MPDQGCGYRSAGSLPTECRDQQQVDPEQPWRECQADRTAADTGVAVEEQPSGSSSTGYTSVKNRLV